jgi:hypothetical protein
MPEFSCCFPRQRYGRRALESLLTHNRDNAQLVSWAIRLVYEADKPNIREQAFLAIASVLQVVAAFPISHVQSMCLALFMSADLALPIKQQAKLLLHTLKERVFGATDKDVPLPLSLPLTVMSMHAQDQLVLSRDLATRHPDLTLNVFLELSHRFQSASKDARRMCLSSLTPWLEGVQLIRQPSPKGFGLLGCHPFHVLNNLLFMCLQTDVGDESLKLWASLCQSDENVVIILEYLIEQGSTIGCAEFVYLAKRIVLELARISTEVQKQTQNKKMKLKKKLSHEHSFFFFFSLFLLPFPSRDPQTTIATLTAYMASAHSMPRAIKTGSLDLMTLGRNEWVEKDGNGYVAPLQSFVAGLSPLIDLFNPALIFTVEVVQQHSGYAWRRHLPLMLHALFLGLDHTSPYVHRQCQQLLFNLVHCLVLPKAAASSATSHLANALITQISRETGALWPLEDVMPTLYPVPSEQTLATFLGQVQSKRRRKKNRRKKKIRSKEEDWNN